MTIAKRAGSFPCPANRAPMAVVCPYYSVYINKERGCGPRNSVAARRGGNAGQSRGCQNSGTRPDHRQPPPAKMAVGGIRPPFWSAGIYYRFPLPRSGFSLCRCLSLTRLPVFPAVQFTPKEVEMSDRHPRHLTVALRKRRQEDSRQEDLSRYLFRVGIGPRGNLFEQRLIRRPVAQPIQVALPLHRFKRLRIVEVAMIAGLL